MPNDTWINIKVQQEKKEENSYRKIHWKLDWETRLLNQKHKVLDKKWKKEARIVYRWGKIRNCQLKKKYKDFLGREQKLDTDLQ